MDIGHPAQVHFFKNMIWMMEEKGHEIKITARDKDITIHLLRAYGLDYESLGKTKKGIFKKALGLLEFDYKLLKIAKLFNPDIFVAAGSMYSAHTAAILRKPYIAFEDTEHSTEQYRLYAPFATAICTPECFKRNLGHKQIRYNGFKELAYLHPKYFSPDPSIMDEIGIAPNERFIILRFVSWNASHDRGHSGIGMDMKRQFISEIMKYGRVLITSESMLPKEFEQFRINVAPEKLHDLLYYASLYMGEGATMATEAGILGTPSVYISPLAGTMGNFEELKRYDLVYTFTDNSEAINRAVELLKDTKTKEEWNIKRERLFKDKIDVTAFMMEIIEDRAQP